MALFGKTFNPRHHEHKIYYQRNIGLRRCVGCKEMVFDRGFVCTEDDCHDFVLHKECFVQFEEIKIGYNFRGRSDFVLVPSGACTICFVCGTPVNGYGYFSTKAVHGSKKEKVMVHPPCARLPYRVRTRPEGPVLMLDDKMKSKCFWCNEKRRPNTSSNWGYTTRGINIHVSCLKEMFILQWQTGSGCSDNVNRSIANIMNGGVDIGIGSSAIEATRNDINETHNDVEAIHNEVEILTRSKNIKLISSIKNIFCKIFFGKKDRKKYVRLA